MACCQRCRAVASSVISCSNSLMLAGSVGNSMAASIPQRRQSEEVRTSDRIGLRPAKAHLKSPTSDFTQGNAIWDVLVKAHGSVNAAAITMGNTDPSLLRRQVLDGTLPIKKLFEADPKALAAFGEFLVEQFGDSRKSKAQIAREKIPALLAAFLEAVSDEGDKR